MSYSLLLSLNSTNVYVNPDPEIINPTNNVLNLGIFMTGDCSFEFHIKMCVKMYKHIWLDLRTSSTRDIITI